MIPIFDIALENLYRFEFKKKCKYLYGFDYEKAEKVLKNYNNQQIIELDMTPEDIDIRSENEELEEILTDEKIDKNVNNSGRNTGAIVIGGEIANIVISSLPTAETVATTGVQSPLEAGAVAVKSTVVLS